MSRNVLLVDADLALLRSLAEALREHRKRFQVLIAGDAAGALAQLARQPIALVVADLEIPGADGLALLARVQEGYPDIPIVVMATSSTPEKERLARNAGALGYLEKPFQAETLAETILEVLEREADGGTLHGVSSAVFLQLVRMERRTCTIRLTNRSGGQRGTLFFVEGELIDARLGTLQGEPAAHKIFAWKEVDLAIQNGCPEDHPRRIHRGFEAVLFEAMRVRDESEEPEAPPVPHSAPAPQDRHSGEERVQLIRSRLASALGSRAGSPMIRADDSARGLVSAIGDLGNLFGLGRFQVAHLAREGGPDTLVVAAHPAISVELDRRAPRDRVLDALRDL